MQEEQLSGKGTSMIMYSIVDGKDGMIQSGLRLQTCALVLISLVAISVHGPVLMDIQTGKCGIEKNMVRHNFQTGIYHSNPTFRGFLLN